MVVRGLSQRPSERNDFWTSSGDAVYGKANEIEQIKNARLSRKKMPTKFSGYALAKSVHQIKMQRRQKFCKIKRNVW